MPAPAPRYVVTITSELGVAVDLVPQRAADRAAVVLDDESVEHRRVFVRHGRARRDVVDANSAVIDFRDPRAIVVGNAANLHRA